jgi:hypothetical protein
MADIEAKTALVDVILPTETYPPQDLAKWLTTKANTKSQMEGEQQRKERKKSKTDWTKDKEGLGRKHQVIITRITTGYMLLYH